MGCKNTLVCILGALLVCVAAKATVPDFSRNPYLLTAGQRDGEIEVIEINAEEGSVKVRNSGIVTVLTLDKDGAKLPATLPPASPLAVAPPNAVGYAAPASTPSPSLSSVPGAPSTGMKAIPIRNVRLPVPAAGPADAAASPAQPQPPVLPQSAAQLSPEEEQAIMAELERERARQQTNNGQLPPQAPEPFR